MKKFLYVAMSGCFAFDRYGRNMRKIRRMV